MERKAARNVRARPRGPRKAGARSLGRSAFKMKIVVGGQGAFGVKHLEGIARIPGIEVVSLVGGRPETTKAVADGSASRIGRATSPRASRCPVSRP